jgi:hypothetical protein
VGAGPETEAIEELLDLKSHFGVNVHLIAVSPEWQALKRRTNKLNGFFHTVGVGVDLAQACFQVYSALLHHYRLTWDEEEADGNPELEIWCGSGYGSASYGFEPINS